MRLFRGYVPTKNKKCMVSFKDNNNLFNVNELDKYTEYAGVLDVNTVLIDIDDFQTSEKLFKIVTDLKLRCKVYKTTRGKHFYFKNNGLKKNKTKTKLAIGLQSDIKLGCKNSYAILRFDNLDREIIYNCIRIFTS